MHPVSLAGKDGILFLLWYGYYFLLLTFEQATLPEIKMIYTTNAVELWICHATVRPRAGIDGFLRRCGISGRARDLILPLIVIGEVLL